MATKKVTPKNAEQDKAKAKAKKTDADAGATSKKATRKTGGLRYSDRNLKDNVVVVTW